MILWLRKRGGKTRACGVSPDPVDLHAAAAVRLVSAGVPAQAAPPVVDRVSTAARIEAGEARLRDVYVRRLVVASGLPRGLFELHEPVLDGGRWVCLGCDFDASGTDVEPPLWPCRTAELLLGGVTATNLEPRAPAACGHTHHADAAAGRVGVDHTTWPSGWELCPSPGEEGR